MSRVLGFLGKLGKGLISPQIVISVVIFIAGWYLDGKIDSKNQEIEQLQSDYSTLEKSFETQNNQLLSAINSIEIVADRRSQQADIDAEGEDIIDDILSSPEEDNATNAPVLRRTHTRLNELLHPQRQEPATDTGGEPDNP